MLSRYWKGKSTETVSHTIIDSIEDSINTNYTLGVFSDIERAFNYIKADSIVRALEKHDLSIIQWISAMVTSIADLSLRV